MKIFIFLSNYSYYKISSLAVRLNNGVHPKHRIIDYHKFFVDNVSTTDVVIDIGCGKGDNTYDIAKKAKQVTGIDFSSNNINFAQKHYTRENLTFIIGDAVKHNFKNRFDKIVLSNVLEHIEDRTSFLSKLHDISDVILIRVPLISRDWLTIYKKENNFEYRLDKTHFIEYTHDALKQELEAAGWKMENYSIQFGEIWTKVVKV
ncbi:MAG: class I SAM-dependent methyltransferase [bacterium]